MARRAEISTRPSPHVGYVLRVVEGDEVAAEASDRGYVAAYIDFLKSCGGDVWEKHRTYPQCLPGGSPTAHVWPDRPNEHRPTDSWKLRQRVTKFPLSITRSCNVRFTGIQTWEGVRYRKDELLNDLQDFKFNL